MSSMLTSQGMVLATAMAVSGTVILLAIRLQKSTLHQFSLIVNSSASISAVAPPQPPGLLKKEKAKKKKRVHFAADVVDPAGNGDEYRRNFHRVTGPGRSKGNDSGSTATIDSGSKTRGMPANRAALYSGILRDRRVLHRTTYSSY